MHTASRDVNPSSLPTKSNLAGALAAASAFPNASGIGTSTESLLKLLVGLPHESARSELGTGPEDRNSTLFLQLLYASLPPAISQQEIAILRLRLSSIAISRQHPRFSKEELFNAFSGVLSDGYEPSDEIAFDTVAALLTPRMVEDHAQEPASYLPEGDVDLALQLLDRLSLRGVPILNFKVFNMLYQVFDTPTQPFAEHQPSASTAQATSSEDWPKLQRLGLDRLSKMVAAAKVPFDANEARRLMVTQFRCKDFDGYWRLWHQLPLKGSPRTQNDYAQLFQLHAGLGDERRARDCISMWVPMMSREQPPIVLKGEIVTSLMHCLLVADADIQHRAQDGPPSYFFDVWTQCQRALEQENW